MDIDLLERCRTGDRSAYRGLVSLWGDQALKVALRAKPDRRAAEVAVRDAFLAAWWALPTLHSEHPFRPWLMRLVVKAAIGDSPPPDENVGAILGARTTEQADKAVRSIMLEQGSPSLRQTFFEDEILRSLADDHRLEVRRVIDADREAVWRVLADPRALASWTSVKDARIRPMSPLASGSKITARGAIADKKRSRDETLITRAIEPRLLAWTTRSRIAPVFPPIEFRWTLALSDEGTHCEAQHRLLGVAFPPGPVARMLGSIYAKVEGSMTGSMHRGIERLAALAERRARRP